MKDLRKEMDAEIKSKVVPVLREKGFKGSMPHFRRPTNEGIDLLTFQFDKYGGGFLIEVSRCETKGITTYWGKKILPNKVTAHDLNPDKRFRIQPHNSHWFRFDDGQYNEVTKEVINNLEKAEAWWKENAQQGNQKDV